MELFADGMVAAGAVVAIAGVAWLAHAQYVRHVKDTAILLRWIGVSAIGGALVLIGSAIG